MRSYKTEGIVIKRRNFGEADRIITLFTKVQGKVNVKATGVRKITSRRSSHIELLNCSMFSLYKGRNMPVLTEVEEIDNFSTIKGDLKKIGFAYHICEVVDGLCAENQENEAIYSLIKETLENLSKTEDPNKLVRDFEVKLLNLLGFYKGDGQELNTKTFIEQILERRLKSKQILTHFT